ncbi:MAG: hypothetical protein WBO46_05535 [Caldilineaceae bacterium]
MNPHSRNRHRISPYPANSFYWQYKGRPLLLLGGSVEDNLFQIDDLEKHLDLLASVGGNYVRCTMSSRDPGDVWPFAQDPATGLYDLAQPGEAYWRRFSRFVELTDQRDIVMQIEVWDRFDFAREPWNDNPFNPKNNRNYSADESGLKERIDTHPGQRENDFFHSVPALQNNQTVLRYQQAFVERLLEQTLGHGHILYCMDNETNDDPEWGWYWARFIRERAEAAGVEVQLTEMWDAWDLSSPQHANTIDHPEIFSFVDFSQNNHQQSETHYLNFQAQRQRIIDSGHIRPINIVKTYGANAGRHGTSRNGQESFWRHLLGGAASVRFHRPPSGHGLDAIAQANIRSARMLTDRIDIFSSRPANDLLEGRSRNEAFCLAQSGETYALYFTDGGDLWLKSDTDLTVEWLHIHESRWLEPQRLTAEAGRVHLVTPEYTGYWGALLRP